MERTNLPIDPAFWQVMDELKAVRIYRMGMLTIWVGYEATQDMWNLSISHPTRYPTWDEVAHARYQLLPADGVYAMLLPPSAEYFSVHHNMFHLVEVRADPETANTMMAKLELRRVLQEKGY